MLVKDKFHKFIDEIEDEKALEAYFELVKTLSKNTTGKLWNLLSENQKSELLISFEESFDPKNLVSHEEVKKKYTSWVNQ